MSRAEQPAVEHREQTPNPANPSKHPRRRVRKRRYHVRPEALGLEIYHLPTTVNIEPSNGSENPKSTTTDAPIAPATPPRASAAEIAEAEFRLEEERKLRFSRRALWTCIAILLLIIFRKPIGWLLDQAVSAWPSINGF